MITLTSVNYEDREHYEERNTDNDTMFDEAKIIPCKDGLQL